VQGVRNRVEPEEMRHRPTESFDCGQTHALQHKALSACSQNLTHTGVSAGGGVRCGSSRGEGHAQGVVRAAARLQQCAGATLLRVAHAAAASGLRLHPSA